MKICMNRPHAEYRAGECYDLPMDIAERWVSRGLASLPGTPDVLETAPVVQTVPKPDALALARAVMVTGGKYKGTTVGDVEREDYAYLAKFLVAATDPAVMDAATVVVGTR
jgi:hypothetical protein